MGDRKKKNLSLEETNAMRARIGLKPLRAVVPETARSRGQDDTTPSSAAWGLDSEQVVAMHEKLSKLRAQRQKKQKAPGIPLGLEQEEDAEPASLSAADWVKRSRRLEDEGAKRAMLQRMEEEEEEEESERVARRGDSDVAGMRVRHALSDFRTGEERILVLKDRSILDDKLQVIEDEDELEDVKLVEAYKLKKTLESKVKKPVYNPYDNTEMLAQYDEEEKEPRGFALDAQGDAVLADEDRRRAEALVSQSALEKETVIRVGKEYDLMEGRPVISSDFLAPAPKQEKNEVKIRKRKRRQRKTNAGEPATKRQNRGKRTHDRYDFLGDADEIGGVEDDNAEGRADRGRRDVGEDRASRQREREEEARLKRERYIMAIQRANLSTAGGDYLDDEESTGEVPLDREVQMSLQRVEQVECGAAGGKGNSVAALAERMRREREAEAEVASQAQTKGQQDDDVMYTSGVVFTEGLKDRVDELREEATRRARNAGRVAALEELQGEDAPQVVDEKGLAVRSRHYLDHLLELKPTGDAEAKGTWKDMQDGDKDVNMERPKSGSGMSSSSGSRQSSPEKRITAEILEREPLVANSMADALKHIQRRYPKENFDDFETGKGGRFRPIDVSKRSKSAHLAWSVDRVGQWLREGGLGNYREVFRRMRVDGKQLDQLTTQICCRLLRMEDRDCATLLQRLGELRGDPAPDIRLDYLDDDGRPITAKRAFQVMSHRFHGKKPGMKKQAKRLKKRDEALSRRKKQGIDTPCGMLTKLKMATETSGKPYILIDGKETARMAPTPHFDRKAFQ